VSDRHDRREANLRDLEQYSYRRTATRSDEMHISNETEVRAFQSGLKSETQIIAAVRHAAKSAMESLWAARDEALKKGLDISPRGGTTASTRTFDDTVRLWNSRFCHLDHW